MNRILVGTVTTLSLLTPLAAQATNGYFAHGYGVRSKSMGGVGAAFSQDATAVAVNPAGMAFVGDRLDLEMELFSPHREYTVSGTPTMAAGAFPLENGTRESGDDYFAVPTLMYAPNITVSGKNPLSPTQNIDLEMYQVSFQAAWSHRF